MCFWWNTEKLFVPKFEKKKHIANITRNFLTLSGPDQGRGIYVVGRYERQDYGEWGSNPK